MNYNLKQIALGIGDIFIIRLLCDTHKITDDFEINLQIVRDYRGNTNEYKNFLKYLLEILFNDRKLQYIDNDSRSQTTTKKIYNYYAVYPFDKNFTNIKHYFNLKPILEESLTLENKYIIFHTKSRIDNTVNYKVLLPVLENYFKKFKTNYKIILMGEKKMSDNIETNIHHIVSIYDSLVHLKINNDVIDLTVDELYNVPDKNVFERDLKYIANAEMNFGLGWGGNFALCWATTNNFSFFIHTLQHQILNFFTQNNIGFLFRNMDDFLKKIESFSS